MEAILDFAHHRPHTEQVAVTLEPILTHMRMWELILIKYRKQPNSWEQSVTPEAERKNYLPSGPHYQNGSPVAYLIVWVGDNVASFRRFVEPNR